MEISLCMIVKNEESTIARCINSVKSLVDEIIVVDTGSTDNTISILETLNIVPYKFTWINDFSAARNFSFSKATKDYILWLDADDILDSRDVDKFKELKSNLSSEVDGVSMNYILTVNENGEFINSLKRYRLIKNLPNFKWVGPVHEYINVFGNLIHSDINIIHSKEKHYTNRNLLIYEDLIKQGKRLSSRDKFYYANELFDNKLYNDAIKQYKKFLKCKDVWVEDVKSACLKISSCYNCKKDYKNELYYLLKSLEYDSPRPDICCRLGLIFLEQNKVDAAIFWYNAAINSAPSKDYIGYLSIDSYTFIPWIQLCVCYSRKGDLESSYLCNEKAATFHPDHPSIKYNREFFKNIDLDISPNNP